jgi:hypothetical protein
VPGKNNASYTENRESADRCDTYDLLLTVVASLNVLLPVYRYLCACFCALLMLAYACFCWHAAVVCCGSQFILLTPAAPHASAKLTYSAFFWHQQRYHSGARQTDSRNPEGRGPINQSINVCINQSINQSINRCSRTERIACMHACMHAFERRPDDGHQTNKRQD